MNKTLLVAFSATLISISSQALACNSPKWCQQTPNATNNWSSASYVCGCNDAPAYDNNPKLGQQASPNTSGANTSTSTSVYSGGRSGKTIQK